MEKPERWSGHCTEMKTSPHGRTETHHPVSSSPLQS